MTFLRRLLSFLSPIVVCRQQPLTIAEMRKQTYVQLPWRTPTRTHDGDPKKLAGARATGQVKSFDEWVAKHGQRRRA